MQVVEGIQRNIIYVIKNNLIDLDIYNNQVSVAILKHTYWFDICFVNLYKFATSFGQLTAFSTNDKCNIKAVVWNYALHRSILVRRYMNHLILVVLHLACSSNTTCIFHDRVVWGSICQIHSISYWSSGPWLQH